MRSLLHRFTLLTVIGGLGVTTLPVALAGPSSGSPSYSSTGGIAGREIARRTQRIEDARAAAVRGDEFKAQNDAEGAIAEYRAALDVLPRGPVTDPERAAITAKFVECSIVAARQRARDNGDYPGARSLLNTVLSPAYDPDNEEAKELLKQLDDPEYFNPANSVEHMTNVRNVERLLRMGIGYYDLGDFDAAVAEFNKALVIDPYNTASRRLMEKVERNKSGYYRAARDQNRAKMLNEVDKLWETAVPNIGLRGPGSTAEIGGGADTSQLLVEKLKNIIVPSIQFEDATIDEAITFLRLKSKELDSYEPDPARKGINFILRTGSEETPSITLSLSGVPLGVALKAITELAGLRYRVDAYAVKIVPLSDAGSELYTQIFKVRPDFLSLGSGGDGGGGGSDDPFAAPSEEESSVSSRATAQQILTSAGVTFPADSSAYFNPATSTLVVRNTANNIDLVRNFIANNTIDVKQINIVSKFVEVTQRNLTELGFDWLLGQFNLPNSDRIFSAGGTAGTGQPVNAVDFPFVPPSAGGAQPVGQNPVTRGLRFGSEAIEPNQIDGLLQRDSVEVVNNVSPGILSIAGVFTDPQFQLVIRALNQKKGVDLMSAPSIVTRSGQRAKIEVIREFIYPVEFDPPEIPQDFGSLNAGGGGLGGLAGGGSSVSSFPVTPTTPTAFETRNVGVTLEVDPVVGPDGYTIDLNLAPEVVEFEGFINYGSPIQTGATDSLGQPTTVILTENRIEQPVFATRKVSTAVTVWDGQTVAIGGLIREDVQSVEDKVPILGDLPLIGRLFRSKADEHFKRNLMIFVSAQLIDPGGNPIRDTMELALPGGGTPGGAVGASSTGGGVADAAMLPEDL